MSMQAALRGVAFVLALLAVALSLTVSANLLYLVGVDYAHPGGNPLTKFHPATWAIAASLGLLLLAGPDPVTAAVRIARREPALTSFLLLMSLTIAYSTISVGVSGVAVYVKSYLSAGLLALAIRQFAPARRRLLGRVILALLALNASLALVETLGQFHLVPIYLEETALVDEPGAFRSSALFDHPLTGAMLTMTGLFTALAMRLRPLVLWPTLALFGTALLAFGGRASLGITLVAGAAALARSVGRDLLGRRLRPGRAALLAAGALALPAAILLLVATTGIGGRIAGKLYLDDSAQSRGAEWLVLGLLDTRAWLFGSPIADTPGLIYRVGLDNALTDIENCWLLALINLGIVGFLPFAAGLACLLRHLWRSASPYGRVSIAALILAASTSNSLGRKSNVLFILAACVEASSLAACVEASSLATRSSPRRRPVALAATVGRRRPPHGAGAAA